MALLFSRKTPWAWPVSSIASTCTEGQTPFLQSAGILFMLQLEDTKLDPGGDLKQISQFCQSSSSICQINMLNRAETRVLDTYKSAMVLEEK
ncbi:hypothetical protein EYF80_003140 [Liparis tanakae]|uniref:Uncharacterized protein n=1 Tax=Liparis tanakae TaxID=230148 RepID=A0A4Z2JBI6_9TELE|nr:hypothetical protein EYF80_003140 [Liparis tanakae]